MPVDTRSFSNEYSTSNSEGLTYCVLDGRCVALAVLDPVFVLPAVYYSVELSEVTAEAYSSIGY